MTRVRVALDRAGQERHVGVRVEHGRLVYLVVPVEHDGRAVLLHYSVTAPDGVLSGDEIDRQYLAHVALEFIESGIVIAIDVIDGKEARPTKNRPDDATLLRDIHRALANGQTPRHDLARKYSVTPYAADVWLRHARKLPNNGLPPAKRGRPRKESS